MSSEQQGEGILFVLFVAIFADKNLLRRQFFLFTAEALRSNRWDHQLTTSHKDKN